MGIMSDYFLIFFIMSSPIFRTGEDVWNATFMLVFLVIALAFSALLNRTAFVYMTPFDVFVLSATTFRLIRLFTYDKITSFIRVYLENSTHPFKRTLFELIICPWCTGIWAALFSTALYLLFPMLWFVFVVLAISGIASFVQIMANSFIRYSEKSIAEKRKAEEEVSRISSGK